MNCNKRRARRAAGRWELELCRRSGSRIQGRIVNISETGILFVSPGHHFEPGELLGMAIDINPNRRVRCVARIVRQIPGSRRIASCAAEFLRFVEEEQNLLQEMLSEILRRTPEEAIPAPDPTPWPMDAHKPPKRLFQQLSG